MQKKVLSEIALYTGDIEMPKGFEINRSKIKNDIITSYLNDKRLSKNSRDYAYCDYEVPFSQPLGWLQDYVRDHFNVTHHYTLIPKLNFGCVYKPEESSYSRCSADSLDFKNSADYTFLYGIDVAKDSCEVVIEFDDNRRKNRTWHISLANNKFVMFPSTQKYFINKNKSKQINVILTTHYEYL